ncbi:MAG: hypothetical protein ITG01_01630 [Comamonas sp.]|nr:hypothetical protein [Comamonas sp.]
MTETQIAPSIHYALQRFWLRAVIWVVALGAMAAVFAWYLQPDLMLTLADQVWACF